MAKRRRPKKNVTISDIITVFNLFYMKLYILSLASALFGTAFVASLKGITFLAPCVLGLSGVLIGILYISLLNDYKKAKKHGKELIFSTK